MGVNSSFKGIRTFCLSSALVMTCVFMSSFTSYLAALSIILTKQEAREAGKKKKKRHHKRRVEPDEEIDSGFLTRLYRYVIMIDKCD